MNHPPFHPYCRSTSVPVVDMEGLGTRIARDPETGENYKVPGNMKYEDWKKAFVKPPAFALIHDIERVYRKEEIDAMAGELAQVVGAHIATESKWSGNIVFNAEGVKYGKLWNCDIATLPKTAPDIILHEMLHACSVSYYNLEIYQKFSGIEEAAVQFMATEIGKRENIAIGGSGYDDLVEGLRTINRLIRFGSDYDFAKQLLEIPLPERLDWLENEIYGRLSESRISISDYQEIEEILEEIRTFKP